MKMKARFDKARIEAARNELSQFSGDFDQVISDLHKAIEGGEFSE